MRWAFMMIRLAAACRNTSVKRTTGTAPEPMMSVSTCPGPTDGSWSISPTMSSARDRSYQRLLQYDIDHRSLIDHEQITIEGIAGVAFEPAAPGIDLEQPVDGLGLDARRFGHALRRAARGRAKQQSHAFDRENLKDRIDDRRLADAWAPSDHQRLRRQRQADCRLLAVGKLQTAALFDPR